MPYTLYVHNKDKKGNLKSYGSTFSTKEQAEAARKNLRAYYRRFSDPKDLKATRIVKEDHPRKTMSSREITEKIFTKKRKQQ